MGVGGCRPAWAVKFDWLKSETMPEANKLGLFIAVVRHYLETRPLGRSVSEEYSYHLRACEASITSAYLSYSPTQC